MTTKRILASFLIFCLWVASMGALVVREVVPYARVRAASGLGWEELLSFREYWMGVYYEGAKMGYTHVAVYPLERTDQAAFEVRTNTFLRMAMLGRSRLIFWLSTTQLDSKMRPSRFEFHLKSGPYETRFLGHRDENRWILKIEGREGVLYEAQLPVRDHPYPAPTLGAFLALMKWSRNQAAELSLFDPFTQSTLPVELRVTDVKEEWESKPLRVFEVETVYQGLKSKSWVSEEGEVLREESPLGFVAVKEKMEDAMQVLMSNEDVDLTDRFAIESNLTLERPRDLAYMKARISGLRFGELFLEDERQKILDRDQGVVEIRQLAPAPAAPVSSDQWQEDPALRKFLASSAFVQSDHPKIRELARGIAGEEREPFAKAKRILEWVGDYLQPTPSLSIPSSLDVLAQKKGDCNEFTVLFTALARAAGIPTRMISGLIYLDGKFYYHAWPKVFVGEWVDMDAALGQAAADATHIGLLEGELREEIRLVPVLGHVEVEILEAR